eukprot:204318-Hanusia_phi.AAC.1
MVVAVTAGVRRVRRAGGAVQPSRRRAMGYSESSEEIGEILLSFGEPIVDVPDFVLKGFRHSSVQITEVGPSFLREFLVNADNALVADFDRNKLLQCLTYSLSDMILGSPVDTDGGEAYKSLVGIPLIPTAD